MRGNRRIKSGIAARNDPASFFKRNGQRAHGHAADANEVDFFDFRFQIVDFRFNDSFNSLKSDFQVLPSNHSNPVNCDL